MAYTIAYTDQANKGTITIEDNTINTETSLKLLGRNRTEYGSVIAENFLHLLENFANDSEPSQAVEGQLWYDSTLGTEQLKVYDGTNWVPAGNVKKAQNEPDAVQSLTGDLWVDTDNQQLYLFSGSGWVLVGPTFSDGLQTGASPVKIIGTDDTEYTAIQVDVASQPVAIIATQTFTPKTVIPGFTTIQPGINLSNRDINGDGAAKFYGTAEKAENLIVANTSVPAGNFLRGDTTSTTTFPFNVQNNTGVSYGINGELNIGVEGTTGVIQHQIEGSSIDLKVRNNEQTRTVVRVDSNLRVGINNEAPDEALDVDGNIQTSGVVLVNSVTESSTFNTGSIITKGGIGVAKNVNIAGNLVVTNSSTLQDLNPDGNSTRNLGTTTSKWRSVYATDFFGNLVGNVSGTVSGRAGSADKLTSSTTFQLGGDVTANDFIFDGQTGGSTKTFTTTISNALIASKDQVLVSQSDDEILLNRITGDTGLKKISRRNLLDAVPTTPIATVTAYAGSAAPAGWLLCYGQELLIADYQSLFDIIGYTYGAQSIVTSGKFKIPDLRGRFALGKDNMGGTSADNVTASSADNLGSTNGSEDVTIGVENLPEHKHDMRGDSGDQYYAIRDVSGTPNDNDAIVYDAPDATGNGQAIANSGGILTTETLGTSLDVMNPYLTINYIIYTGRE